MSVAAVGERLAELVVGAGDDVYKYDHYHWLPFLTAIPAQTKAGKTHSIKCFFSFVFFLQSRRNISKI